MKTNLETPRAAGVPFLDLGAQFASIREEVCGAVLNVLERQQFILGPEVRAFEEEFARHAECEFAIGCASGSDALLLALTALGIDQGDEVITTPFTFVATAGSIARLKAKPVFVDIDPNTYNIAPEQIEAAITQRTRVILPVHLFGMPADMDPILEIAAKFHLALIEDAAQAVGAKYREQLVGGMGAIGCFSFFPSKNLGGAGDAGMVVTNDAAIADRLRVLRVHGSRKKYEYELLGINSRLDTIQAAILRVKLRYLDGWAAARRRNATRYRAWIDEFDLQRWITPPAESAGCVHVYNQFVVRASERDALRKHLSGHGIPTEIYYPSPLHLQRAFAYLGHTPSDFPNAERASQEVLALPIYPELEEWQQRAVIEAIAEFYSNRGD